MGRWRITIEGTGCHHNGPCAEAVGDADLLAARFVDDLKAKGSHTIHTAEFAVLSQCVDLTSGATPATPTAE